MLIIMNLQNCKKNAKNLMLFIVTLCLLSTNCIHLAKNQGSGKTENIDDIDIREIFIMNNISLNKKKYLSEIASKIEYCMLETDEKCLVTPDMFVYVAKNYVVTAGYQTSNNDVCYVFDRITGKFVRQISSIGQGPNDYQSIVSSFWDEKKEQILALGNRKYLFFNLDGTLSHTIDMPLSPNVKFIAFEDYYVGYDPNRFGNSTIRIAFFDNKTGTLIDSIPNYRSWKKTTANYSVNDYGWLYVFRNNLYYRDIFCDTLYHIKDFKLHPRYIFNTGGRTVPYEIQEGGRFDLLYEIFGREFDRYEKYVYIFEILEDANYLFFTFDYRKMRYPSVYNKIEDILQIMPPVSIPPPSRNWIFPRFGFDNDIDFGLPFWPLQMISEKEMMCVYTAEELLDLDKSKITDEKLKNVLNSLEEDSNPVVAIVTLKD